MSKPFELCILYNYFFNDISIFLIINFNKYLYISFFILDFQFKWKKKRGRTFCYVLWLLPLHKNYSPFLRKAFSRRSKLSSTIPTEKIKWWVRVNSSGKNFRIWWCSRRAVVRLSQLRATITTLDGTLCKVIISEIR